jgi:hypothetical protein
MLRRVSEDQVLVGLKREPPTPPALYGTKGSKHDGAKISYSEENIGEKMTVQRRGCGIAEAENALTERLF